MVTEGSKFFFSYAREDSEIVLRLARELRKAGANLWLDQLDIRGGQRWDESVQAALESCQGMVAVLSPSAVASPNFLDEVSYALEERKQVIPLLYRECAIPFRLRRVQYVNFAVNYDDGFAELLRSLGLGEGTEVPAPPVAPAFNRAVQPTLPALPEREQDEPALAPKNATRKIEPNRDWERDEEVGHEAPEAPRQLIASRDTERPTSRAQRAYRILGPRGAGALVGAAGGSILGALSYLLFYPGVLFYPDEKRDWCLIGLIAGVLWAAAGFATGTNRRRITVVLLAALATGLVGYSAGGLFEALAFGAPLGAFLCAIAILFVSIIEVVIYKKLS